MQYGDEATVLGDTYPEFRLSTFVEHGGVVSFPPHTITLSVVMRRSGGSLLVLLDDRTARLIRAPHTGYVWLVGGVITPHLQSDGWGE